MVNAASAYDAKIQVFVFMFLILVFYLQKTLEECKITPKLMSYIENFNYPYVNDVQTYYEQLLKIGQGTFGFLSIQKKDLSSLNSERFSKPDVSGPGILLH